MKMDNIDKYQIENKYQYQAFGLNIRSGIEIPEFVPAKGEPDINIRFGRVPDSLEGPKKAGVRFQAKPDCLLLKVDNIAKYLASNGNQVIVEKSPGAEDGEIRLFLLSSVFGALLHQRGLLPLHASAIKADDKCVVFCGASGNGKSTIAKAFIKRGYDLHADDICVISVNNEGIPLVYPGYPQLKLWQDALIETGEKPASYSRVRRVLDKFAVPAKDQFNNNPLILKKIYILQLYNKSEIEISAITGMEKFNVLKNHTYRVKFIEGLEKEVSHFKTVGIIGNQVPISRVERPRKPFLLNELADLLENDFGGGASSLNQ